MSLIRLCKPITSLKIPAMRLNAQLRITLTKLASIQTKRRQETPRASNSTLGIYTPQNATWRVNQMKGKAVSNRNKTGVEARAGNPRLTKSNLESKFLSKRTCSIEQSLQRVLNPGAKNTDCNARDTRIEARMEDPLPSANCRPTSK